MKRWSGVLGCVFVLGCNYDEKCWPRGQGGDPSAGVGSSVVAVGVGAGGFGEEPGAEPQGLDEDEPECAFDSCKMMYTHCMDILRCTREIDWGKTLCAHCLEDCRAERPYRYAECYQCAFE